MAEKTVEVDAREYGMLKSLLAACKKDFVDGLHMSVMSAGGKCECKKCSIIRDYDAAVEREANPLGLPWRPHKYLNNNLFGIRDSCDRLVAMDMCLPVAEAICDAVNATAKPPIHLYENRNDDFTQCPFCGKAPTQRGRILCCENNAKYLEALRARLGEPNFLKAKPPADAENKFHRPWHKGKSYGRNTMLYNDKHAMFTVDDDLADFICDAANAYRKRTPREWTFNTDETSTIADIYMNGDYQFSVPSKSGKSVIYRLNRLEETRD